MHRTQVQLLIQSSDLGFSWHVGTLTTESLQCVNLSIRREGEHQDTQGVFDPLADHLPPAASMSAAASAGGGSAGGSALRSRRSTSSVASGLSPSDIPPPAYSARTDASAGGSVRSASAGATPAAAEVAGGAISTDRAPSGDSVPAVPPAYDDLVFEGVITDQCSSSCSLIYLPPWWVAAVAAACACMRVRHLVFC